MGGAKFKMNYVLSHYKFSNCHYIDIIVQYTVGPQNVFVTNLIVHQRCLCVWETTVHELIFWTFNSGHFRAFGGNFMGTFKWFVRTFFFLYNSIYEKNLVTKL